MRETAWLMAVVAVLVGAAIFAFIRLPALVVSPDDLRPLSAPHAPTARPATGVELVTARNGVRTAAVALIAGFGAALAAGFAARTYYLSRRTEQSNRFEDARKQLAKSDEALRVSAIADLELLARDAPRRRSQIQALLCTFLRTYERPVDDAAPPSVERACATLKLAIFRSAGEVILANADLRRVNLDEANLRKADFRDANLRGAWLRRANLREANFANADARDARFDKSNLRNATMAGTLLQAATLDQVNGRGASFEAATFYETPVRGARLSHSKDLAVRRGIVAGTIPDDKTKLPKSA